jgi:tetratricopeptide (TPR) repeat protein
VSLANQGRISEAEEALERATAIYRDNHRAWYNLGQVREMLKEYESAAEAYGESARVKDDEAMYHYKLGKAFWRASSVSSAQVSLERALLLNSRLYSAQYCLGQVYEAQGKPKQAAEAWSMAAALNPMFGRPFVDLGNLYIRWDKLSEAVGVLDQGRINVRDRDLLTEIYYSLGIAHGKLGNWDKSIEAHTEAIENDARNLDALRQRGFAYAEKGDKKGAVKDLESFLDQGGGGDAFSIQAARQRIFRVKAAR